MNLWWIVTLILLIPLLCFTAFLALSSCFGDRFRARLSGFPLNPRHGAYDHTYFRTMTYHGPGMSEHIEMETMLNDASRLSEDSIR